MRKYDIVQKSGETVRRDGPVKLTKMYVQMRYI